MAQLLASSSARQSLGLAPVSYGVQGQLLSPGTASLQMWGLVFMHMITAPLLFQVIMTALLGEAGAMCVCMHAVWRCRDTHRFPGAGFADGASFRRPGHDHLC